MNIMKRTIIILLALIISLSLISCGEQTEHDRPEPQSIETDDAPDSGASAAPSKAAPTEASAAPTGASIAIPSEITTQDDLKALLCGKWGYYEQKEELVDSQYDLSFSGLEIDMDADGSFTAYRYIDDGGVLVYGGKWSAVLNGAAGPEDTRINFDMQTKQDATETFGNFYISGVSYCDGELLMNIKSIGNSIFSEYYSAYSATLVNLNIQDVPSPDIPQEMKGAHFNAVCWKTADDGKTVWLSDMKSGDFARYPRIFEASKFTLSNDADIRCNISLFAFGGVDAEVETNEKGEITMINTAQRAD